MGAWSASGPDGQFDVSTFEAFGTWLGALGALGVAGVAGWYTYARHVDEARQAEAKVAAAEAAARRKARTRALMCAIRTRPLGNPQIGYSRMHFAFENKVKDVVFRPSIRLPDGSTLDGDEQVWHGYTWGKDAPLEALELDANYPTKELASAAFKEAARDKVTFEFTLRGYRFARRGSTVKLLHPDDGSGEVIDPALAEPTAANAPEQKSAT
ncbi:hypothetical protein [Microbacterium sp. Leaf203]|uniref:hypothetical protein n=1 Tax=Microbacterium sp. Leaf203 TaxID=1735677 RepID=UPI00138EF348|nr:hypothetical protein [Microbacterium sp. Leaf203]